MTDRELLELAAKAAGYDISHPITRSNGEIVGFGGICKFGFWNPLTEDGDALRLAGKLGMTLRLSVEGYAVAQHRLCPIIQEANTEDIYAANRRAIVRAAAAISSNQPSKEKG